MAGKAFTTLEARHAMGFASDTSFKYRLTAIGKVDVGFSSLIPYISSLADRIFEDVTGNHKIPIGS